MFKKLLKKVYPLLLALVLLVSMAGMAGASSETGTDLSGADKAHSGAADDGTYYQSASYSVALQNGEWIREEIDWFTEVDIDFYVNFRNAAATDYLEVEIKDSDDSDNLISVRIYQTNSGAGINVKVDDSFRGDADDEEAKTIDLYALTNGAWATVSIEISKTAKSLDGSRQKIQVDVNGTECIDMELVSPEKSANAKVREWDEVEWSSHVAANAIYVDDWDIDDTASNTYGYTWTLLCGGLFIVVLAGVWYFGMWPLSSTGPKALKSMRRKVGRK